MLILVANAQSLAGARVNVRCTRIYSEQNEEEFKLTVAAVKVYLYAAVEGDLVKAFAAADVAGIPQQNVLGNYSEAWRHVQNGDGFVVAVGGAALFALYYNPCNWSNPGNVPGGHTPFIVFPNGQGIDTLRAGYFVNAAGYTALDSLKLAVMLAYYAVHGTFPAQFQGMPQQEVPQQICVSGASPNVGMTRATSANPQPATTTGNVGVYASFQNVSDVTHAISLGWPGVGVTGGLGTQTSPYTSELSSAPDKAVSSALNQTSGNVWWLSFWTVSWPAGADTFYDAGHAAGQYVAEKIMSYGGKYIPNYVIIDPEGYNTPASTATEWGEFIHGWSDSVTAVSSSLKPAFYVNQSQYVQYDLASVNLPAFIAVSPIQGNKPFVAGTNIHGYIAYYATCPATADVDQVRSYGGALNTVQFRDSGVDCGP